MPLTVHYIRDDILGAKLVDVTWGKEDKKNGNILLWSIYLNKDGFAADLIAAAAAKGFTVVLDSTDPLNPNLQWYRIA